MGEMTAEAFMAESFFEEVKNEMTQSKQPS
jgi:hypothetical protein